MRVTPLQLVRCKNPNYEASYRAATLEKLMTGSYDLTDDQLIRLERIQSGIQVGAVQWICQMDMSRPRVRPPMTDDPTDRSYWTGHELAPKLPILLRQLTSSYDDDGERFRKTKLKLERLPYSHGGMSYSFFEFIRRQAELVKTLAPEQGIFVPAPGETESLSYMLDAFLDHARRTADAVIPYLRERYSLHDGALDKSMAKSMEKILDKVPDLDVSNLIKEYWERHGKTAKAYRDVAQHYELLASDCRLFVDAEGTPALYLAIPKNPKEAKDTPAKPSYDPPEHALPYMCGVFYETIRFVNRLSFRLLRPHETAPTSLRLDPILGVVLERLSRASGLCRWSGSTLNFGS